MDAGLSRFWIPSSRVKVIGLSKPPSEYLGASLHWVSHGFLHPSHITCLVLC